MVRKGFTLVELMIVILIVAILAAVAIPLMTGRIDSAKWSEAKSAMGTIGTGIRSYYAEKGCTATPPATLNDLGITTTDLDGTYFVNGDYQWVGSTACLNGVVTYTITCTSSKANAPASNGGQITMTVAADPTGGTTVTWSDGTKT